MEERNEKKYEQEEPKKIIPQEKYIEHYTDESKKTPKKIVPVYEPPHKSKKWMWIGVTIFSVAIFAMWGLNLFTVFYESGVAYDPAKEIISTSKQDLQNIIKTFSEEELEEETTREDTKPEDEDIEKNLRESILNLMTATTTFENTTSTTNTIQLEQ